MKSGLALAAIAVGPCALSACDPLYGISRDRTFAHAVDVACIEGAVRATAGVSKVTRETRQDHSFAITPHWGPDVETAHYISYEADGLPATVTVFEDALDPKVEVTDSFLTLGDQHISREQIAAYRVVMARVEGSMRAQCGVDLTEATEFSRTNGRGTEFWRSGGESHER